MRPIWLGMTTALMLSLCTPAPLRAEEAEELDWGQLRGVWKVQSAERDGQQVEALEGLTYLIEEGLMRWVDPDQKSEITGMPIMMARRLQHEEANRFRTDAIFPPAADGHVDIAVEGDAMVLITQPTNNDSPVTLVLEKRSSKCPNPPAGKLLDKAKQAWDAGDFYKAYIFSQLQLMNYPDDKNAALLLAYSHMRAISTQRKVPIRERQTTIEQAGWALDKHPGATKVRDAYANLLFRASEFQAAVEQYELLEKEGHATEAGSFRHAEALARIGRRAEGVQVLGKMIGFDLESLQFTGPGTILEANGAYLYLAMAKTKDGDKETAIAIMDEMATRFPDKAKSFIDRGRLRAALKMKRESNEDFAKALQIAPNDRESILVNIESHLLDPDPWVDELIQRSIKLFPDDTFTIIMAGSRAGFQKQFEKGLTLVDEALETHPGETNLLQLKVQLLAESGAIEEAEALLKNFPQLGIDRVVTLLIKAKILIRSQRFSEATRILVSLDNPEVPAASRRRIQSLRAELKRAMDGESAKPADKPADDKADEKDEIDAATTPST